MDILKFLKRRPWGIVGAVLLLIVIAAAILAPVISSSPYNTHISDRLSPPGNGHILGTDNLGRDLYSRLLYGTRAYLEVSLIAIGIALVLGSVLGFLAAKTTGKIDSIFRWSVYILSFIGIISILCFALVFFDRFPSKSTLWFTDYLSDSALNIPNIIYIASIMISTVLLPAFFAKFRQVFRASSGNSLALLLELSLVSLGVSIGLALTLIASPSYYGSGLPPPTPEWASILSSIGRTFGRTAPWIILYPTIAIFVTTIGAILFGVATYEIWFPRLAPPLVEIQMNKPLTPKADSTKNPLV